MALLVLLVLLVAGGIGAYRLFGPYRGFGTETFVDIPHGTSSRAIAKLLARQGIVRSAYAFLAFRLLHPSEPLQAGEYQFASSATPYAVFEKIRRGEIFYEEITVPEGSNMFDIAELLEPARTAKPFNFLEAASDPSLVSDLDPRAPTLEGYLFPSTYRVTHKTTAKQLCRMMVTEFRREWAQLAPNATPEDTHHAVTLASLVEKETGAKGERPLVAGVFDNRLRLHMPLQCDPTTVYAALLEKRYHGIIHRSDLVSANPYNTYAHAGLPPGPIANPGVASLRAALAPAQTDFLYFVAKADGSGGHHFSSTLEAHQRAVLEYRKELHP